MARLTAALELSPEGLGSYVRQRRGRGELLWSAEEPLSGSEEQEAFRLGKHKGRLFSEVAREDVDYCRLVRRKVEQGGFQGDAALDRQVRSFVAYLNAQ